VTNWSWFIRAALHCAFAFMVGWLVDRQYQVLVLQASLLNEIRQELRQQSDGQERALRALGADDLVGP
jgi:hypothetical protein